MARSFELRAALCLAKLYRAANRDADAHAVLAPAVEGFPPTRQFLEVTEAQTLLAALSESDAVKNAAALHQRRLQLQISLGNALIWVKGQDAPETSAAFARVRELANQVEDVPTLRRPHDRDRGVRARLRAKLAPDAEHGRHVMTEAYCERRDFPVPTCWLYAGSDLSRPDHGDQCAARAVDPLQALAEMPIAGSPPRLSHIPIASWQRCTHHQPRR